MVLDRLSGDQPSGLLQYVLGDLQGDRRAFRVSRREAEQIQGDVLRVAKLEWVFGDAGEDRAKPLDEIALYRLEVHLVDGFLLLQSRVVSVLETILARTDHEESLIAVFYRLHLMMRTLAKLSHPEDFQTVRSTARSLYELFLDLQLLASDNSLAEKYWGFVDVERMRSALLIADFVAKNPTPELTRVHRAAISLATNVDKVAECEGLLKRAWGITTDIGLDRTKKFPRSWSQKSVRGSAEGLGVGFIEEYITEYPISSWFTHGGFAGIGGMSRQHLINSFGRGHHLAQDSYRKATLVLANYFRLFDAVPDLGKCVQDLEGIQGEMFDASLRRKKKHRE